MVTFGSTKVNLFNLVPEFPRIHQFWGEFEPAGLVDLLRDSLLDL
jgi:hypothetical protein